MKETISRKVEETLNKAQELLQGGQLFEVTKIIEELTKEILALLWETLLKAILSSAEFLRRLRVLGGKKALRFVSYQVITIILPTGTRIQVRSPFFVKAKPRRGRKKRGPQKRGAHLALELLGFVDKVASALAFRAIQLAVLAPSFEIASQLLNQEGIDLSVNKIRRLCAQLGALSLPQRVKLLLKEGESFAGKRVFISIDGGRVRSRKKKRGRIPKGKKRQGFHADWKEPKLFTIYLLDEEGNIIKDIPPFVDATTGKLPQFLKLFSQYLESLQIEKASEVILAADGALWIWERVPALLKELGVAKEKISEVLDWTHAKQNLWNAIEMLPQKIIKRSKINFKQLKKLLFEGKIEQLSRRIKKLYDLRKNSKTMKKLHSYFLPNQKRMQYKSFQERKLPIGSGVVESAIRRVINLRLKAPGSFWKLGFAEIIIFLRAQVLYGRWQNLLKNWIAKLLPEFHSVKTQILCKRKAA